MYILKILGLAAFLIGDAPPEAGAVPKSAQAVADRALGVADRARGEGDPACARRIDRDFFCAIKQKFKEEGGAGYRARSLLDHCIQSKKHEDSTTEALAQALVLGTFPDSPEAKFLMERIDPKRISYNLLLLFHLSAVVDDAEVRVVLLKSINHYFRYLKKVPDREGFLPLLALADPTIDPNLGGSAEFSPEDREVFKALVSKESDLWKCKKILLSKGSEKYFVIFHFLQVSKDEVLFQDVGVVKFAVLGLLSHCQFATAAKLLEKIAGRKSDFSIQFLYGWSRALSGEAAAAAAIFKAIGSGRFTKEEIQAATDSAELITLGETQKKAVDELLKNIAKKITDTNPEYLSFQIDFETKQGNKATGDVLICPGINKVEFKLIDSSGLSYYSDTSIFGTKIKEHRSKSVFKNDSQIYFPYLSMPEECKSQRGLGSFCLQLLNSKPANIPPISSWMQSYPLLKDSSSRIAFLEDAISKGYYFKVISTGKMRCLRLLYPDFDECKILSHEVIFDENYSFKCADLRLAKITNLKFGINFDDKKLSREQSEINEIYGTKKQISKSAMHLHAFEPNFVLLQE